ncbi:MAG: DRTGG domain-containing protein [Eubacteriales bacterium]|nr:DRTGG domain-containing protein [Eubacteriales bacterium]
MKIREIQQYLNAEILCNEQLADREIISACGSDLMSDVLAFVKEKTVLLTGLTNPHVVRTAEMLDVSLIVFVRGKYPMQEILDMAQERDIVICRTDLTLYEACGVLYSHGLRGGARGNGE